MNVSADWQPTANHSILKLRAELLKKVRAFFETRDVLEVETPVLSHAGVTDLHITSFQVPQPGGELLYLQSSPEYHMKRLLAAGSGDIYQLCRVFREGESGRQHNPEFTLLEWYRLDFDIQHLMQEVAELIGTLLPDMTAAPEYLSYREAFERYAGFDPFRSGPTQCQEALEQHGVASPEAALDYDSWLDLIAGNLVYPALGEGGVTFIYDYPVGQAALARIREGDPPVAERFEAFVNGMELANGFHELADAREQQQRFLRDLEARASRGLSAMPLDHNLLAALHAGLPDCAGVALGFDRLVMLAANTDSIEKVIAFPIVRA